MKFEMKTDCYNERRYGRPYIGAVDFPQASKPNVTWGSWVGSAGEEGLLTIEAPAYSIIMIGQKDNRNNRNSTPSYYQLMPCGNLSEAISKADAYRLYQERQSKQETSVSKALIHLHAALTELEKDDSLSDVKNEIVRQIAFLSADEKSKPMTLLQAQEFVKIYNYDLNTAKKDDSLSDVKNEVIRQIACLSADEKSKPMTLLQAQEFVKIYNYDLNTAKKDGAELDFVEAESIIEQEKVDIYDEELNEDA